MTNRQAIKRLTPQEQAIVCEALANLELMARGLTQGYVTIARRRAHHIAELLRL